MIRDRFVPRAQWEAMLRKRGCSPLSGSGPLNSAEWWQSSAGYPFVVPVEDDGSRDFWALQKLREQLALKLFDKPIGPGRD
jgi:hypothetical protein